MKIIAYISLSILFLTVGFSACNQKPVDSNKEPRVLSDNYVEVVIYDSCEYIVAGHGNNRWGSHKGDCKNPIHHINLNDSTKTLSPFTGQNW
jgi:hypothetical protein